MNAFVYTRMANLKTLYDYHFLLGADMNEDETPISVSVVGVIIGVCGAVVLIVGGTFKKLQGKHKGQELPYPIDATLQKMCL